MYKHAITRNEQGKYRIYITLNGKLVYSEECTSERNARNGTIRFMWNGPNVGNTSTRHMEIPEDNTPPTVKEYLGYADY